MTDASLPEPLSYSMVRGIERVTDVSPCAIEESERTIRPELMLLCRTNAVSGSPVKSVHTKIRLGLGEPGENVIRRSVSTRVISSNRSARSIGNART
jgi:hypothetical protein